MKRGMPNVRLTPVSAVIRGGMDLAVAPMFAKPGTAVLAYNYEYEVDGGVARVMGIEPFDGRPAPSSAAYTYVLATATVTGIVVGDTLTGDTSAATGKVIYISGAYLAMTRVTGTFVVEALQIGGITKATVSTAPTQVTARWPASFTLPRLRGMLAVCERCGGGSQARSMPCRSSIGAKCSGLRGLRSIFFSRSLSFGLL